jgi:hypothetical protein
MNLKKNAAKLRCYVSQLIKRTLSENMVLITGCQRSGTTLLLLLIGAHSKVRGFDESEVYHCLPSARHLLKSQLKGLTVCWKNPQESAAVYDIKRLYPHAKSVWIIRNPLSVVSSMRRLQLDGWKDNWLGLYAEDEIKQLSRVHDISGWEKLSSVQLGARIWRLNVESMHVAKEIGINTISVKFENLAEDVHSELKKVCQKIGIRYEKSMVNFHKKSENQGRVLAGGTKADRKINTNRKDPELSLTEKEKQDVLEECMPWVEKFGYS